MITRTAFPSRLDLRLSDEEEERIKEAAKREGMSVSAWMRRAAYRTAMAEDMERRQRGSVYG